MGLILVQPKYRRPTLIFTGVVLAALFYRLGFSSTCGTAPAPVPSPDAKAKAALPAPQPALLTHPILKTPQFCGLDGRKLDPSFFKALNSIKYEDGLKYRGVGFDQAELEAANQVGALIEGKSKKEIENLLGKPSVCRDHQSICRCLDPHETRWHYYIGYTCVRLQLIFHDDVCTISDIADDRYRPGIYGSCEFPVEQYGVGTLLKDIVAREGEPDRVTSPDSVDSPDNSTFYDCGVLDTPKHPDFVRADRLVIYEIPDSHGVRLAIKNGRCIRMDHFMVCH